MPKPPWARPKREDGELAARIAPPSLKQLTALAELFEDERLPGTVRDKAREWWEEQPRSAMQARDAIERLRERIEDAEGRQADLFTGT